MAATFRSILQAATGTLRGRCITSSLIFLTGDTVAQQAVEKKGWNNHDVQRTSCMVVYGGMIYAPIMSFWFKQVGKITHPNKIAQTAMRVVVDQGVGGPAVPVLFFTSLTLMQGGTLDDVRKKLKAAWLNTWKLGASIWIPFSTINMSLVPADARLLSTNAVALCWNIYLSYTNERHRIMLARARGVNAETAKATDQGGLVSR